MSFWMRSSLLTTIRTVTATNPMIAIQNAHAFGLSYPNRLVIANQKAHAFGPSSSRARQKRKTKSRSFEISPVWQLLSAAHHPVHRVTRPLHNLPFEMQSLHSRDDCTELLWKVSFSFSLVQTSIMFSPTSAVVRAKRSRSASHSVCT